MDYDSVCVRDICEIFASVQGFWGWAIECCQSNFTPTDKMGYNSKYVRDIFEILASNKGFFRVEQINNFNKSTMVDSRCHGNKICRIFAKNWLELG